MCSQNEDITEELISREIVKITENDFCRKCSENKAKVVLREKDFYCYGCFLEYFGHKFRSTIGKSKMMKPGDEVVVGFSGDLSSTSLLHLIREGLDDSSPKRIRFVSSVLFIDESILGESPDVDEVAKVVTGLGFPFFFTSFQEVMRPVNEPILLSKYGSEPATKSTEEDPLASKLKSLISGLGSQTSRKDLISIMRTSLICRVASQIGASKVFLAESGTSLAVRILADMALGRGAHVTDHVNFKADLFGVEVYRPMREIFDDELNYCVEAKGISLIRATQANEPASIFSCTKDFVLNLQKNFVSTVPTILRTGAKLDGFISSGDKLDGSTSSGRDVSNDNSSESNSEGNNQKNRVESCSLCSSRIDRFGSGFTAVKAVKVSKAISSFKYSTEESSGPGSRAGLDAFLSRFEDVEVATNDDESSRGFCYGCANLTEEIGSPDLLPPSVSDEIT